VIPEHEPDPWAMQLVVMRDRHHPARQVDVCEAAARAVVALLDDPRSAEGGPWFPAVQHWNDHRIRKLVRRADGKRWTDVQELDGVTVEQDGVDGFGPAAVRAFPPAPVQPLPKALDKLQVSGTHFPDEGVSANGDAVVTIEINPSLEITSGKAAAQCGHAAQLARQTMPATILEGWRSDGFRVRVVTATEQDWNAGGRPVSITDAGFTELDGPTETTRAYWRVRQSPDDTRR
jgi:peptidyl-tRNA hydrolase